MEWIFITLIVVIVLAGVIAKNKNAPKGKYEYRKRAVLFSPAETRFLLSLEEAISHKYRVFGKVRVADVITPKKGSNRSNWQIAFNKISAKHFDYILCSKEELVVVAAVELDDKSHGSKKAKARDALLEDACSSANLKLIRFSAKSSYDIRTINDRIEASLDSSEEGALNKTLQRTT